MPREFDPRPLIREVVAEVERLVAEIQQSGNWYAAQQLRRNFDMFRYGPQHFAYRFVTENNSHLETFEDKIFAPVPYNSSAHNRKNEIGWHLTEINSWRFRRFALSHPDLDLAWRTIYDIVDLLSAEGYQEKAQIFEQLFKEFLDAPRSYSGLALGVLTDEPPWEFWEWDFLDDSKQRNPRMSVYTELLARLRPQLEGIYSELEMPYGVRYKDEWNDDVCRYLEQQKATDGAYKYEKKPVGTPTKRRKRPVKSRPENRQEVTGDGASEEEARTDTQR